MYRFIKTYTFPYWPYYFTGAIALTLTNYVATLIPLKIKDAIDLFEQSGQIGLLLPLLKTVVGLAVVLIFVRTLSRVLIFIPGRKVEYDLRNDVFKHLLTLSASFYRTQKIGDLMSRMINDMQSLRATAALGFLHIINTIMIFSLVCYQMALIDWRLTCWVILPVPFLLWSVRSFVKYMYTAIKSCQSSLGDFTNYFIEMLSQVKIIKGYVAENAVLALFHKKNNDYFKQNLVLAKIRSGMFPFFGIISSIGQLILLFFGGQAIINAQLSVGEFVAMGSYITLLGWPIISLAWILNILQRGKSSWERISGLLNECSEFTGTATLPCSKNGSEYSIKDLTFSYKEEAEPVLKDISLTIKPGTMVGIFGPSGSGKSTLASILAGYEAIDKNMYFIDKCCFRSLNREQFLSQVSYVAQQPFLFSSPIFENIGFSHDLDNEEEYLSVTDKACVTHDIRLFPDGFKTLIGERGVVLSGGQKSRLGLARALFKSNNLLILDDVLSAVDHDTEHRLIDELSQSSSSHSIVMVSHRISALTKCDTILVLDKGTIIDQGTHDDLLARDGLYRRTWEYQKMLDSMS